MFNYVRIILRQILKVVLRLIMIFIEICIKMILMLGYLCGNQLPRIWWKTEKAGCNFFSDYSFMTEETDLRHIMGVGIAITRGSASALSFCYSLLLLTMCRNGLTKLKEYSIQQYIPLDSHIQFHKIVACTALFFSLLHTVGHIVNFYHVSTQPISHLRCLTSEVSFSSDDRPDIVFWLFQTLTGQCFWTVFQLCNIYNQIFFRGEHFEWLIMIHFSHPLKNFLLI